MLCLLSGNLGSWYHLSLLTAANGLEASGAWDESEIPRSAWVGCLQIPNRGSLGTDGQGGASEAGRRLCIGQDCVGLQSLLRVLYLLGDITLWEVRRNLPLRQGETA